MTMLFVKMHVLLMMTITIANGDFHEDHHRQHHRYVDDDGDDDNGDGDNCDDDDDDDDTPTCSIASTTRCSLLVDCLFLCCLALVG